MYCSNRDTCLASLWRGLFFFLALVLVLAIYPLAILGHEAAVLCCMCTRSKQLAKYLLISLFSDESVRFMALRKRESNVP